MEGLPDCRAAPAWNSPMPRTVEWAALLDAMATLTGPRIADLADVDPILGPGRRLARTWLEMIIKFRRAGQRTCRPRTRDGWRVVSHT
jgi:hypothetical protein